MSHRVQPSDPPHCPNPRCDFHLDSAGWPVKKKGFYRRRARQDRIQRYLCQHCGRSFSSQTFSATYWLRCPDLLRAIFFRIRGCSGLRQIAQELGVAHSTVQRQVERLGRHCLLFHEHLRPACPREPLALDGFRCFESGHYWPFDLNLVVGESHYVYGFNEADLRRSGTMTAGQRRRRRELEARFGRPHPQATRKAVEELLGRIVPRGGQAVVRSDEHASYPRAVARLRDRRIEHETTSSRKARTARNPLFPVNLADLLLRHGSANHKRETIAFSKRRQGALYRAAIWTVWRNYVKSRSERTRSEPPAVALGIVPRRLSVDEILSRRLFPSRVGIQGWVAECYAGRIRTRCLARNRTHELRYAA
jgi:transposase-like protein